MTQLSMKEKELRKGEKWPIFRINDFFLPRFFILTFIHPL